MGKPITGISGGAMRCLQAYIWPGNIRELENAIERAVALERTPSILLDSLPEPGGGGAPPGAAPPPRAGGPPAAGRVTSSSTSSTSSASTSPRPSAAPAGSRSRPRSSSA